MSEHVAYPIVHHWSGTVAESPESGTGRTVDSDKCTGANRSSLHLSSFSSVSDFVSFLRSNIRKKSAFLLSCASVCCCVANIIVVDVV